MSTQTRAHQSFTGKHCNTWQGEGFSKDKEMTTNRTVNAVLSVLEADHVWDTLEHANGFEEASCQIRVQSNS